MDPAAHGGGVAAEQPGDLARGPAVLGEQYHHQAAADAVGAVQQAQQIAEAGGVGVHAGGTHTGGGLVGSFGV